MMPHFDRHLLYPLLNFPPPAEDEEQPIDKQKVLFELLKPTYMTGYVGQLAQNINNLDHIPDEYLQKQDQEKKRLAQLEEATSKLMELLSDEAVLGSLRSDKQQNLAFLEKEHGVTVQMVEQLYEEAQFKYGCGLYGDAADLLTRYRILVRFSNFFYRPFAPCLGGAVCANLRLSRPPTTTRNAKPPGESLLVKSYPPSGSPPLPRSRRLKSSSTVAS